MSAEIYEEDIKSLRLPKDWHSYVRSAVLNVVGIVRVAMLAGRGSSESMMIRSFRPERR